MGERCLALRAALTREGAYTGKQNFGILNVPHTSLEGIHHLQLLSGGVAKHRGQRLDQVAEFFKCHAHAVDRSAIAWIDRLFALDHPVEGDLNRLDGFCALLLLRFWRLKKCCELSNSTSYRHFYLIGVDTLQVDAETLHQLMLTLH